MADSPELRNDGTLQIIARGSNLPTFKASPTKLDFDGESDKTGRRSTPKDKKKLMMTLAPAKFHHGIHKYTFVDLVENINTDVKSEVADFDFD